MYEQKLLRICIEFMFCLPLTFMHTFRCAAGELEDIEDDDDDDDEDEDEAPALPAGPSKKGSKPTLSKMKRGGFSYYPSNSDLVAYFLCFRCVCGNRRQGEQSSKQQTESKGSTQLLT